MNTKTKPTNPTLSLILFALVLIGGFMFGGVDKASADDPLVNCQFTAPNDADPFAPHRVDGGKKKKSECEAWCAELKKQDPYKSGQCETNFTDQEVQNIKDADAPSDDVCKGGQWFTSFVVCTLLAILKFMGMLLSVAATIFGWTLDANNMKAIISNPVIYQTWAAVRDLLNITFIFVLLYSAFSTIFQASKYNYKSVLLNLIIMALLVNFSFPIARFIIDLSNSLMFYMVQTIGFSGGGAATMVQFAEASKIKDLLSVSVSQNPDKAFLIMAIVFVFILAITLLAIGILLLIRNIALAILIIFSPIAFIGTILPGTQLAGQADKWWKSLMSYCFFGPTVLFFVHIALHMTWSIANTGGKFEPIAGSVASINLIAPMSFFAIPIIILWMGLAAAKESSVAGAGMVVGKAQGIIQGAGKKLQHIGTSPYRWTKKGVATRYAGAKQGLAAQRKDLFGKSKWTKWMNTTEDETKAQWAAKFGDKKAVASLEKKKMQELRDDWKNSPPTKDDIQKKIDTGSQAEKKAAAIQAAEKTGFKNLDQYQALKAAVENDPVAKSLFDSKVKEKHIKLVIDDEVATEKKRMLDAGTPMTTAQEDAFKEATYKKNLGKMNAAQLAKQEGLHENIHTDKNLQMHVAEMARLAHKKHEQFFGDLSAEQQAAYEYCATHGGLRVTP